MMTSNWLRGVGIHGVSWTHHVAAPTTAAAHAVAAPAITPRKRRTTAATLASVNRGPV